LQEIANARVPGQGPLYAPPPREEEKEDVHEIAERKRVAGNRRRRLREYTKQGSFGVTIRNLAVQEKKAKEAKYALGGTSSFLIIEERCKAAKKTTSIPGVGHYNPRLPEVGEVAKQKHVKPTWDPAARVFTTFARTNADPSAHFYHSQLRGWKAPDQKESPGALLRPEGLATAQVGNNKRSIGDEATRSRRRAASCEPAFKQQVPRKQRAGHRLSVMQGDKQIAGNSQGEGADKPYEVNQSFSRTQGFGAAAGSIGHIAGRGVDMRRAGRHDAPIDWATGLPGFESGRPWELGLNGTLANIQAHNARAGSMRCQDAVNIGAMPGRESGGVNRNALNTEVTPDRFYELREVDERLHPIQGSQGLARTFHTLPTRHRQRNTNRLAAQVGPYGQTSLSPQFQQIDERDYLRSGTPPRVWQHPMLRSKADMEWVY